MSNIPGITVRPDDDDDDDAGYELTTFTGKIFTVPQSHLSGNCRFIEGNYVKLNVIPDADGAFGNMFKCRDLKTGAICAAKRLKMATNKDDGFPTSILREMHILGTYKHINIVNSYETLAGNNLESNYLLLEYCTVSLDALVKKGGAIFERETVKYVMRQLFEGLDYIHESLILHRDIHCQNILFTEEGILKISGFRSSRLFGNGNMTPGVTKLTYRAPELLFQSKIYGPAVDMWSTGCIFARLLLKKALFTGNSELEVLSSIFNILGTPDDAIWPGFTEVFSGMDRDSRIIPNLKPYSVLKPTFAGQPISCQNLIQELLVYCPNLRINAKNCLASTFFIDPPRECSLEKFASIVRDAVSAPEDMDLST